MEDLDEWRWVATGGDERLDVFDHMWFVVGVGDAEPVRGRGEDVAVGLASVDEVVNGGGKVAFAFELGAVVFEKIDKIVLEFGKVAVSESPEVHGDDDVFFDLASVARGVGSFDVAAGGSGDVDDFLDSFEESVFGLADASIDRAVV